MKAKILFSIFLLTAHAWAEFRAGAAKVDITPKVWPVQLVGSFSERLADKAHDPLHARAIVCDDGQTRLAIVIVDNCLIGRNYIDRAKALAAKRTKVRADRILVAATHTHTAPPGKDRRTNRDDAAHRAYFKQLVEGIAEAIARAEKNLAPAEMAHGVALVPEEIFNRRWHMKPGGIALNPFGKKTDIARMNPPRNLIERPAGPTDPEVHFVSLRGTDGRPIALLANYSLHYVGGIPAGGVSALVQQLGVGVGVVAEGTAGTGGVALEDGCRVILGALQSLEELLFRRHAAAWFTEG